MYFEMERMSEVSDFQRIRRFESVLTKRDGSEAVPVVILLLNFYICMLFYEADELFYRY